MGKIIATFLLLVSTISYCQNMNVHNLQTKKDKWHLFETLDDFGDADGIVEVIFTELMNKEIAYLYLYSDKIRLDFWHTKESAERRFSKANFFDIGEGDKSQFLGDEYLLKVKFPDNSILEYSTSPDEYFGFTIKIDSEIGKQIIKNKKSVLKFAIYYKGKLVDSFKFVERD